MNIGDRVVIDTNGRLGWADGKTGTIIRFDEQIDPESTKSFYKYQVRVDDMDLKTPPYGLIAVLENEIKHEVIANMDIQKDDSVNHPSHYTDGKYECIDYLESRGFTQDGYLFNAVKYISRAGKKDPEKYEEDIRKAIWYLNRKMQSFESKYLDQKKNISTIDYIQDKGLDGTLPGIALELIDCRNYSLAAKVLQLELDTHDKHSF
jgi:hypothetical protein